MVNISNINTRSFILFNKINLNHLGGFIMSEEWFNAFTNKQKKTITLTEGTYEFREKKIYKEFYYDCALSFAGEDRVIVDQVVLELRDRGFKVFYDDYYTDYLLGKDLSIHFKKIYSKKSKFVIIFISKHYRIKEWTNFEFEIALYESKLKKREYILPIKLDNTDIPGLSRSVGFIDYNKIGFQEAIDILSKKLTKNILFDGKEKIEN